MELNGGYVCIEAACINTSSLFSRAMVSWKGIYFVLSLFLGSFFGSIFMLGPLLPLMFFSPAWYRWITDRVVATWLTLPVVSSSCIFMKVPISHITRISALVLAYANAVVTNVMKLLKEKKSHHIRTNGQILYLKT